MKFLMQAIICFTAASILFLLPAHAISTEINALKDKATQGQVEAQFELGDAYYYGKGTGKNLKQALYWYEKAAEQGDVMAQRAVGAMYELGQGTGKDGVKAAYWYEKAAAQGLARAQTNLGIL